MARLMLALALAFICNACRNAADTAVRNRTFESPSTPALNRVRSRNVAALHAACRGGTWCECQHGKAGHAT